MVLSNDSALTVDSLSELYSFIPHGPEADVGAADFKLLLHDSSVVTVAASSAFVFSGELNVLDSASMAIWGDFIAMDAGRSTVASEPDLLKKQYSLSIKSTRSDGGVGLQLEEFLFTGRSASLLSARCIALAEITAKHNAMLIIKADEFDFATFPAVSNIVTIGAGSALVSIAPCSEDKKTTFDFLDESINYPQGMFNFVNAEGCNAGVLRLSCAPSSHQASAMVSRKLLCINGVPVEHPQDMNIIQSSDLQVLVITNK